MAQKQSLNCSDVFDLVNSFTVCLGVIQTLEEQTTTNKYLVSEMRPKEIDQLKKNIHELQKIVSEPAMGQSDLDAIRQRVNKSINVIHCRHGGGGVTVDPARWW